MKNHLTPHIVIGLLIVVSGCGKANTAEDVAALATPEVLIDVVHADSVSRVSEGDVEVLADGRLAFVYQQSGASGSDFARMDIVMRTSADGGRTWSDPTVLVSAEEAGMNVMSPSVLRTQDGELLLFYLRKNGFHDCRTYVRRSSDELGTLSEPVLAIPAEGYFVVNNARVVQLEGGRLIVPASFHPADGDLDWSKERMFGIPVVFYSDDLGLSWQQSQTSLKERPVPGIILQEPGVLELNDGRLLMWMRTSGGFQYESFSEDQGETWSTPVPGGLASPLSPATISRIPWTGDLVAVWNDHSGDHPFPNDPDVRRTVAGRTPLAVAVSRDEGSTWARSRLLENDKDFAYAYPSISFDGDRMIVSYGLCKFGPDGYCDMRVKAVGQGWLYGG